MPCEACGQPDRDAAMVLFDKCGLGYHYDCLDPPLTEVPEGNWSCKSCNCAERDITGDKATVSFLMTGNFPSGSGRIEKARIKGRALRYSITGDKLIYKETGKEIPPIAD